MRCIGVIIGSITGVTKGDARSLDYSLHVLLGKFRAAIYKVLKPE